MKKAGSMFENMLGYLVLLILICGGAMIAIGLRPFIVISGSMEPEIKTGSICFVNTRASFYEVKKGDVIAFKAPSGALVTHRVIGAEENGRILVTKGDNNDVEDGQTTTVENFCGKTLFSIPYAGYVVAALQEPKYKIMAGIVITALVLLTVLDYTWKGEVS